MKIGVPARGAFNQFVNNKVGEGTYSHVYRAFDPEKKKIVALKKIKVNHMLDNLFSLEEQRFYKNGSISISCNMFDDAPFFAIQSCLMNLIRDQELGCRCW